MAQNLILVSQSCRHYVAFYIHRSMNVHPSATDVRSSATSVRPSAMNAVCAASLFKICCIVFFLVTEILYICEWKNAETDIMREVNPKDTSRAKAFELWMKAHDGQQPDKD